MTPVRVVDATATLIAIGVGLLVVVGEPSSFRPASALAFVLFVPGWTMIRLARVPVTSLAVLGAFVLSVVAMTLTSFLLVTRLGWAWRPAALAWAIGCAGALVAVMRRDTRPAGSTAEAGRAAGGPLGAAPTDHVEAP